MEFDPFGRDPKPERDPLRPDPTGLDPTPTPEGWEDPATDPNRLREPVDPGMSPGNPSLDLRWDGNPRETPLSDPTKPLGDLSSVMIETSKMLDPFTNGPEAAKPIFDLYGAQGDRDGARIDLERELLVTPAFGVGIKVGITEGGLETYHLGFKQAVLSGSATYTYPGTEILGKLPQPCSDMKYNPEEPGKGNSEGWIDAARVVKSSPATTRSPSVQFRDAPNVWLPTPGDVVHEYYGRLQFFSRESRLMTWLVAQWETNEIPLYHWDWTSRALLSYETGSPVKVDAQLEIMGGPGPHPEVPLELTRSLPIANETGFVFSRTDLETT